MDILFLTDNFPPEGNAPATRTYEHARYWVKAGHKVTVITCAPNFPDGKVFPGYKNSWYQKELVDGITLIRVKTYITANEGFVRRTLDYFSFMVTSFFVGLFQREFDVIVATSPQFFTAVSGWLISLFRHKPFVFELRDIWPASIVTVGAMKNCLAINILEKLELFLYARADLIISVTHAFKAELIKRGIDGDKISVILNGVDLSLYKPVEIKDIDLVAQYKLQNKFIIGYIGTHGMAHALNNVIDTAENLAHRNDIVFIFAGGGATREQIEGYSKKKGLSNVIFIERQPKEMMPRLWSLCDVSLAHLKNDSLFKTVIPSKIFESMGMGVPIIMSVPKGEATGIICHAECGLVVPPEDSQALAKAVMTLADDQVLFEKFKHNSINAAKNYNRDDLASDMLNCLKKLTKNR